MADFEVVKQFDYNGRNCVVIKSNRFASIKGIGIHCNGYVECPKASVEITCEEITFQGDLAHVGIKDGKYYIGFDTAHSHNELNPETKTVEAVEEQCKRITEELNNKEERR